MTSSPGSTDTTIESEKSLILVKLKEALSTKIKEIVSDLNLKESPDKRASDFINRNVHRPKILAQSKVMK